jgi:hypothetical protein
MKILKTRSQLRYTLETAHRVIFEPGPVPTNLLLPGISLLNPTSAPPGSAVTISGINFTGATAVTFGGVSASFSVVGDRTITATVPFGVSGNVNIAVVTPIGSSTPVGASQFLVMPSTPVLTWTSDTYTLAPQGTATFDNTVLAGYVLTSQLQVSGGDWSSPVVNNVHTITSLEDTNNEVDLNNPTLAPGSSYDWRVKISNAGIDSAWSNIQTKTLAAWTPAVVSPVAWFEVAKGGMFQSNAGSGTPTANNGDVIGYLPDQSGAAFHVTSAANDTTRPTLQGVGVHPYASYNGTNSALYRLAALGGTGSINAGSYTWGAVFRSPVGPPGGAVLFGETNSTQTNTLDIPFSVWASNTADAVAIWRSDTPVTGTINGNGQPTLTGALDGNDHVLVFIYDGNNATWYLDGVSIAVIGPSLVPPTGGFTINVFSLGCNRRTTVSSWWSGRIYGAVCVNTSVSSTDRARLTTYLGNLAGLSL